MSTLSQGEDGGSTREEKGEKHSQLDGGKTGVEDFLSVASPPPLPSVMSDKLHEFWKPHLCFSHILIDRQEHMAQQYD